MLKVSKVIGQKSLGPTFAKLIGEFVIEWGWLEFRLQEALWHFLGTDRKTGRILTGQVDTRGLARALRNMAKRKVKDAALQRDISELGKKVGDFATIRNALAHGIWYLDGKTGKAVSLAYRDEPITGGTAYRYDDATLREKVSEVRELRLRLQRLMDRV